MRIIGVLFSIIFLGFYGLASAERGHGDSHSQMSPHAGEFKYGYSEKDLDAYRQFLTSKRLGLLDKATKQAAGLKNSELRQKAHAMMAYEFARVGDMKRAEEFALKLTNSELRWRVYYFLAVDGYASRGNIIEALASAEISMTALADLIGIAIQDRDGSELLATQRNKLWVDILVSCVETGQYNEEVLPVLGKMNSRPYYWLMAVEQLALRLYDRQRVEKFLTFVGYELCEPSEEELARPDAVTGKMISDLPAVYYHNASRDFLIAVKYGADEETGKESVFIIYSVLTPEQALARKDTK
ncbi:MAG: hypothetical protein HZC14_03630 [Candidatus Niyogibacteria bacterium]|nr:hypothetical protein [Candidatus Niyogibacteria bacterium]